jgi:hypothetical protein
MKILKLMEDKSLAKRIGEAGKSFVEEKHDAEKVMNRYLNFTLPPFKAVKLIM